jgi:hypothetical protein
VEPVDPKKLKDEQFQAEHDALVAVHESWKKYFASQSPSAPVAQPESPELGSFQE